jgi:hypothetical protein
MDRRIDILVVEPGKAPRPVTMPDTVEAGQSLGASCPSG